MTGISFRRTGVYAFALVTLLCSALLTVSGSAEAKGKSKSKSKSKAAAAEKAEDKKAKKKTDAADKKEAEEPVDTDTDADAIFTEDEVSDTLDEKIEAVDEEEDAEEPTSDEEELANETEEEDAEEEEEAMEDAEEEEEAVDDADDEVEVEASSGEKNGFFPSDFDGPNAVRRDRGFNIFTARVTRPMTLTFVLDHRPYMKLAAKEAEDVFFDYLGLDGSNLKVGLGLRFGIIEGLDVGLYRLNDGGTVPFDTYEFDARYAFLRQEKHYIDASIRGGISWFAQKDAQDAVGGYGELFVDRVFVDMLLVGVGFQIHSDSTNDLKDDTDDQFSGAVLGVLEWRLIKQLALTAEVAATVVGYGSNYGDSRRPAIPSFSLGLKILTHRHVFALMVSNTQFINADGIVSNTWRDFSDIVFGFQIFREFNFK